MTSLNISGQSSGSTNLRMITNENTSGGTEVRNKNHCPLTIAFKNELLKAKRSASASVDVDAPVKLPVFASEAAANDLMQEDPPDASMGVPEALLAPTSRYKLLAADDLLKLPPMEWQIKDVLPSRGIGVVFGPSGSGKSFLVLDMLQSLAFGSDWFGHTVKKCSVTYVALEGEAGVAGRIKAYHAWHGSTSLNIRYVVQSFKLTDAHDLNDLAEAIQAAGTTDVVVLDTLSRATPGLDENDSKSMGLVVNCAKMLQEMLGGLVLLVHHTGKDASKGMRGHSLLYAALDSAIEVRRNGELREWRIAKSKDGEDGASHSFKLEVVHLATDSDGDAVTSCVIDANQSAQAIAKKTPTLGSNQTIALVTLEQRLQQSVDFEKDGTPPGKPCLDFDEAVKIVTVLMPVEAKYKKQRAKEAITGLVNKNVVGMKGGWLWVN